MSRRGRTTAYCSYNDSNRKNEKIEDRKDRATRETTHQPSYIVAHSSSPFRHCGNDCNTPLILPSTHSYYDDYDKQANKH